MHIKIQAKSIHLCIFTSVNISWAVLTTSSFFNFVSHLMHDELPSVNTRLQSMAVFDKILGAEKARILGAGA